MKFIRSNFLKFKIEIERFYVHFYRFIKGFPIKKSIVVSEQIFVGGQFRANKIPKLIEWGITGILSMRTRYPKKIKDRLDIEFLNLPTFDTTAPTLEQLHAGVSFIKSHIERNGKVYIHCRMGEGRGPTMAAAYFMYEGMTLEDSLESILKIRPFLKITHDQRQRLGEFAKEFLKHNS